jgi:hypothetical protein
MDASIKWWQRRGVLWWTAFVVAGLFLLDGAMAPLSDPSPLWSLMEVIGALVVWGLLANIRWSISLPIMVKVATEASDGGES